MTFDEFTKNSYLKTECCDYQNEMIAYKVLKEYQNNDPKSRLPYHITGSFVADFLMDYFDLKETNKENILENIMVKYGFQYSDTIHNAIYYLNGKKEELQEVNIDPILWPGVNSIEKDNDFHIINTIIGTIKVKKASLLFTSYQNSLIFKKELMGNCFARTYDFIRENSDYKAVLSYMPNYFYGGHYHAYLENDQSILDIASNSFFLKKEDAKHLLNGRIIKQLTYEELEDSYEQIITELPEIKELNYHKLYTLSIYYDR